jgi:hypothetical protein
MCFFYHTSRLRSFDEYFLVCTHNPMTRGQNNSSIFNTFLETFTYYVGQSSINSLCYIIIFSIMNKIIYLYTISYTLVHICAISNQRRTKDSVPRSLSFVLGKLIPYVFKEPPAIMGSWSEGI